jgi:hypothetical protein
MNAIAQLALTTTLTVCTVGCGTAQVPQAAPAASSAATPTAAASGAEPPASTATPAVPTAGTAMPMASMSSAAIESAPMNSEQALVDYKNELHEAGDASRCDEVVARVQQTIARDARLSDVQLQAEIDHFERVKGTMPYPTPGTACSIFGFQKALHGALAERNRGRGPRP